MNNSKLSILSLTLRTLLSACLLSAFTWAADLSTYRHFALGSSVSDVTAKIGAGAPEAKLLQSRPASIQLLEWRPQTLNPATQFEAAQDVAFTFYNGALYRILVNYDRYATEGLTPDDIIEAFRSSFGVPLRPSGPASVILGAYGDEENLIARWEDSEYRFDLIRTSFGPSYKLIGVQKRLNEAAKASIVEAARLDVKEAPQLEAAQKAKDSEIERAKLKKARIENKPKFRP